MQYKNILIGSLIAATIGLAAWSTLSYRPQNVRITHKTPVPDAFMEDITTIVMDKQGKPKLKIVTPKMVHYTENDTTYLISPELTLYRKSTQPWYVSSKFGKSTNGAESVKFWDDVVIHHSADQSNPATIIKTPTLTVHPNDQTAETADLITMIQPNIVVKATGMHADMESGDIKLLSKARGEYVPDS